jgi:hypothetical protein
VRRDFAVELVVFYVQRLALSLHNLIARIFARVRTGAGHCQTARNLLCGPVGLSPSAHISLVHFAVVILIGHFHELAHKSKLGQHVSKRLRRNADPLTRWVARTITRVVENLKLEVEELPFAHN